MPNLPQPVSSQQVSVDSVETSGLEAIALSNLPYSLRFRQHVAWRQREYLTKDLIFSAIGPSLIVGLVALLTGDVTRTTVLWATLSYFALFACLAIKHAVYAPAEIDKTIRTELALKQLQLSAERARNTKPQFKGTIICLNAEPWLSVHSEYCAGDAGYDCYITFHLSLTNESATGGMATGFMLDLLWQGDDYPSNNIPVTGLYLKRYFPKPKPWQPEYQVEWIPLKQFPLNTEITNTNHQIGWLRFCVGALPLEMVQNERLVDDVILRLRAFDNRREPHLIYENKISFSGCGTISEALNKEREQVSDPQFGTAT